jgi:peptide/nickel transport system substrate-binding protein
MPIFSRTALARRRAATTSAVLLTGLLPLITVAACSSAASPTAASSSAASSASTTVIRAAWPADVTSLDPPSTSTNEDHSLVRNVYQSLLSPAFTTQADGSLKFDGAQVKPSLAQSYDIGASSLTFHLRPGVKFYGTNDTLDAEDVKWTFDRIYQTPEGPDLQAIGVLAPSDITIVNPMTVRFDFKTADGKPTPVTPTVLALFDQAQTSIIDQKQVAPHLTAADPIGATWLRSHTAGTGPYYIASRQPGVSFVLKAVPGNWSPEPSYPTVDIQITTGSITSLLQNGEINIGEYDLTNEQVNSVQSAGFTVEWANTGNFDMFAISSGPASQVGALGNVDVRRAIAYALPYDEVLNNIVFGRGTRDLSIVSPTAPEYTPAWSIYSTNLAKAKSLMAQAGNPRISMPLYYLQGDVDQTNTAILIQASLKSIGIATVLTPQTQAGMFDALNARSSPAKGAKIGPPGFILFNWSAWTDDPKIVIGYWATTGGVNNYSLWSSPQVDEINAKYALLPTSAARTAAYKQAQEIIAGDAAMLPIVATGTVAAVAKGITGVSFSPTGSGRYWTLHPVGKTSALDALFGA